MPADREEACSSARIGPNAITRVAEAVLNLKGEAVARSCSRMRACSLS